MVSLTRRHLLIALAASATLQLPTGNARAAATIKLGYQLPLTGDTAQYGKDFKTAAEIALKDFNASHRIDKPVEIIYEDSRSDAKEGIAIARKFADDKDIVAALGDFTSTVSMAAAQVYKRAEMAQLSQTASAPEYSKISKYQFRNITTQEQEGPYNADWMNRKGFKKIAVIAEQTDWGQSVVKDFTAEVEKNGGTVVFSEFFNRGLPDFRSLITKIERAKPDVIYTGFFYEDGAQFLKQVQQLNVKVPVYSTSAAYNEQLIQLAGKAAEGLHLTATFLPVGTDPNVKKFIDEWKAVRGADSLPGQFPAQAYDAVRIMLDAVARAYPNVTRASVRDALAQTKDFPGVTGVTTFDENGDAQKQLVKAVVKDGKFEPVED